MPGQLAAGKLKVSEHRHQSPQFKAASTEIAGARAEKA